MPLTEEIYREMIDRARETYNKRGGHVPMILAFAGEGIAVVPFSDLLHDSIPRGLAYAVLRHVLKLIGADSYVVVSEAWRARTIPASKCPYRIEILQVVGCFPDGLAVHTSLRVKDGKVVGEPEEFGRGTGEAMGGGMSNLLREKPGSDAFEAKAAEFARLYRDMILSN